jgi:hypothetical protein
MSTNPIDYEAVIADLEAKKTQIESAIQAIRAIANLGSLGIAAVPPSNSIAGIPSDAFLGMSIPEASKKLLALLRRRLNTTELTRLLSHGGLPEPAYSTAYAVLRRRQQQVGDIVNIDGQWGLKEWTRGYKPAARKAEKDDEATKTATTEEPGEVVLIEDVEKSNGQS